MSDLIVHPGLVLMLGALLLPFLRGVARGVVVLAVPLAALFFLWQIPLGATWSTQWLGYAVMPVSVDNLARLFATIFAIAALGGGLFALGQKSRLELPAAYLYAGSAIGVVLAGDLITVFVFWELMAVASTLVIWSAATPAAWAASRRYLMIHLLGGVVLFCGIAGHVLATGETGFTRMAPDSVAHWMILAGFLINAGAPPLSAWLPDAYPQGSWSGTVFLSAFTTKAAIYVLIRGFPGTELLIWVGMFMVFYGIVFALLENDLRRVLCYSIVNQVGFMLVGIGIGTEMALNGAAAQAFCHILYKGLLMMTAGSVLMATGRSKCSELGGLCRSMPATTVCAIIGALAALAFPLTSGFVSKSMISQAAVDQHLAWIWLALLAASAATVLHAGIKYPWFVFFHQDSGLRPTDPPANMRWAMYAFAFACVALGVWPETLYSMLPYAVAYEPNTAAHVLTQMQLLMFSALAFFVALPWLKEAATITLDTDWSYRVLLPSLWRCAAHQAARLRAALAGAGLALAASINAEIGRQRHPQGAFLRGRTTASMVLWTVLILLCYLIFYYIR